MHLEKYLNIFYKKVEKLLSKCWTLFLITLEVILFISLFWLGLGYVIHYYEIDGVTYARIVSVSEVGQSLTALDFDFLWFGV